MESSVNQSVVVIGAGVGGIATAIRLASLGFQVSVFEKNAYPGGKLSVFKIGEYTFDAGPSLFTQPILVEQLFDFAGEKLSDFMTYRKVDTSCHYFYEDGTFVRAFSDKKTLFRELSGKFNTNEKELTGYLERGETLYEKIGRIFLEKSLHKWSTWWDKRIFSALAAVKWDYLMGSLHSYNAKSFKDPRLVQLFDRFATYNGSNPYKAPAMLSVIPQFEFNDGTYYPQGGMISITNALYGLACKKGVKFYFNQCVDKIQTNQERVSGVLSGDRFYPADYVVSNMDVYFTYEKLLGDKSKAAKVLRQERSSSALIFYWGVKRAFPELHLHNIFFTADYKKEFECIFDTGELYDDPTVYINITAKMEEGHAPEGGENWFVMINVPANTGQNWEALKARAKGLILQKLNRMLNTDLSLWIEVEEVLDPILIEQKTGSFQGSLYGTSSNDRMAAFLRHPNFSRQFANLFFVGGSVHPGGGIPLCLHSAAIATEMIGALTVEK